MQPIFFKLRASLMFLSALALAFSGCGISKKLHASKKPEASQLVTSDIDHFWQAYDKDNGKNQAKTFDDLYLSKASPGLEAFTRLRIGNANNLTKAVYENRDSYEQIRPGSMTIQSQKAQLHQDFEQLKKLYPKAIFPDVYFLIGRRNSGGTIATKGLLIGVELYTDSHLLPSVVMHELIHYQQKYYFKLRSFTLLEQSVREGSADFIAELITGENTSDETYRYGDEHEAMLKAEFRQIMNNKWKQGWNGWMYGGAPEGRPDDLGYWIGYQIVKAYYDNAADKSQAIKDMLTIRNLDRFVAKSGYFDDAHLAANHSY